MGLGRDDKGREGTGKGMLEKGNEEERECQTRGMGGTRNRKKGKEK